MSVSLLVDFTVGVISVISTNASLTAIANSSSLPPSSFAHTQPGQEGPLPLEVALMKQVNEAPQCPYIMQLLEWFDQPSRYIMVLERPEPCQDLITFCQDRGGTMSEGVARQVMVQLLRVLNHCRERGVLHQDVNPENLLIQTDSQHVKLFDFGCGDLLKNTAFKDFAG